MQFSLGDGLPSFMQIKQNIWHKVMSQATFESDDLSFLYFRGIEGRELAIEERNSHR